MLGDAIDGFAERVGVLDLDGGDASPEVVAGGSLVQLMDEIGAEVVEGEFAGVDEQGAGFGGVGVGASHGGGDGVDELFVALSELDVARVDAQSGDGARQGGDGRLGVYCAEHGGVGFVLARSPCI